MSLIAVYDFTLKYDESFSSIDMIMNLKSLAKKWAFQLEKTENGYIHWQGRMSLIKKKRFETMKKFIKTIDGFEVMRVSPTSNNARTGEPFYVIKFDTRIEGPWTDRDKVPAYIPRQIRECKELRPFQEAILDMAQQYDPRTIDIIYCPRGNTGKSILVGKARARGYGVIPCVTSYKDMMRMILVKDTAIAYFIDIPRAMRKDKLDEFFAGIETIKDGYAYDDRYTFTEKTFDPPRVFVLTNRIPNLNNLSVDRWRFWTINESFELVEINVPVVPVV